MAKIRLYGCIFLVLLLLNCINGFSQYHLKIICVDKDSLFTQKNLGLLSSFKNMGSCMEYINQLPASMEAKGFATVSLDSIRYDSLEAIVRLFLGDQFKWSHIHTQQTD